jgi:hypothetical protein
MSIWCTVPKVVTALSSMATPGDVREPDLSLVTSEMMGKLGTGSCRGAEVAFLREVAEQLT